MQKLFKSFIGPVTLLLFILSIIASAPSHTYKTPPEKPGLNSLYGWNNQNSTWNGTINVAYGIDINGEVGHSLFVSSPTARCAPTGSWYSEGVYFISGTLPPGMAFGSGNSITGIPLDRGHWIVKLHLKNITCEGKYYNLEQELRFHITGTGKVNK